MEPRGREDRDRHPPDQTVVLFCFQILRKQEQKPAGGKWDHEAGSRDAFLGPGFSSVVFLLIRPGPAGSTPPPAPGAASTQGGGTEWRGPHATAMDTYAHTFTWVASSTA